MSDELEIVDRPTTWRGPNSCDSSRAVVQSAETGKAVRISLNGTSAHTLRSRFSSACRIRGLVLRSRVDGNFLIAWAEKQVRA